MKIKKEEFERLAIEKGFSNGKQLWCELGGGELAYDQIIKGSKVGHEIVKNIFNSFGEEATLNLIEFDDETISGLKSKYIQVGNRLFGGVEPNEGEAKKIEVDNYADELIDLFANQGSARRTYPDWYFTKECCSLTKWRLESWMYRNNYTWETFAKEMGIAVEELYWKVTQHKKMSMMDMICLMEIMGAEDLFDVTYFPTKKMRREVEEKLFNAG